MERLRGCRNIEYANRRRDKHTKKSKDSDCFETQDVNLNGGASETGKGC